MNAQHKNDEGQKVNLELIDFKISSLTEKIDGMQRQLEVSFVQRVEFELRTGRIEKIVYGLVSTVLLAVVGGVLSLVLRK